MPDETVPPGKEVADKKIERFVQAFEESSKSGSDLAKAIEDLAGIVDDEKTGLITVMAVLVDEIRGLRKDLRASARAGGLKDVFDALRGG
jgi:hypothetical protein